MKFKFQLQNILRHRKAVENAAQSEFMIAMAEFHKQEQILSDMFEAIARARENAFQRQTEGGQASPALVQVEEFIKGQDIRIERQRNHIKQCEARVEELREILRQKAIEYKIIERYKDRKHEEFLVELNKLEMKESDELTVMRFRMKDQK